MRKSTNNQTSSTFTESQVAELIKKALADAGVNTQAQKNVKPVKKECKVKLIGLSFEDLAQKATKVSAIADADDPKYVIVSGVIEGIRFETRKYKTTAQALSICK